MKSAERTKRLRDLTVEELQRRDGELSEQAFRLRFQLAMGQTETLAKLREVRKDRARLLTIIREKKND